MQDEAKFENKEKRSDLIKWKISDFQAHLPGVRMFSFSCYATCSWSGAGASLGGLRQFLKISKIDFLSGGCHARALFLGPVSRKPRKLFGPVKPFLDHLYLNMEKCIRLKLLV